MEADYRRAMELMAEGIAPAYVLWGDERALQDQVFHNLVERLKSAEVYRFSGEDALEKGLEACDTPSLMGAFKLVCIDAGERSPDWTRLAKYLANPSHTACLAVISRNQPPAQWLSGGAEGHCVAVNCSGLRPKEAVAWLIDYAKAAGKLLPPTVAERLVEASGRSLIGARTELEKLIAYSGTSPEIRLEDYQAVCHAAPHRLFEILDRVFRGELAQALGVCRGLVAQGESEEALFGLLASEVRLMHRIRTWKQSTATDEEIRKALDVQPFRYSRCLKQSARFSTDELKQMLYALNVLDVQFKRGLISAGEMLLRAVLLLGRQRLR